MSWGDTTGMVVVVPTSEVFLHLERKKDVFDQFSAELSGVSSSEARNGVRTVGVSRQQRKTANVRATTWMV